MKSPWVFAIHTMCSRIPGKLKSWTEWHEKKMQNQNESISQQWCSVNLLNNPVMSIALNKSNWKCIKKLWWKTKDKTKMFTNNKTFHQFFPIVMLNASLWRERQQQSIYFLYYLAKYWILSRTSDHWSATTFS